MIGAVQRREDGQVYVQSHGYYNLTLAGQVYCGYYVDEEFRKILASVNGKTTLNAERFWVLYKMAQQCTFLDGEFFECGVHAGGSASFLAQTIAGSGKNLHLFDTFRGMPATDPIWDVHNEGDSGDAKIKDVELFVGHSDRVVFHEGVMPTTFSGLEDMKIAFAHLDVDIRQAMADCCAFVYPRMVIGGIMIIDDYGQPTCPGAKKAVDDYFEDSRSSPLSLMTGQAMVVKI